MNARLRAAGLALALGAALAGCGAPAPAPAPSPDCRVTWLEFTNADNRNQIAALTDDRVGMARAAYDTALVLAHDGGQCFDLSLSVGAQEALPLLAERVRAAEAAR